MAQWVRTLCMQHRNLSSNPSNHVKEKKESNLAMGMHSSNPNTVCLGHWAARLAPSSMSDPVPKSKVECDSTEHLMSFSDLHPSLHAYTFVYAVYTYTMLTRIYTHA